MLRGWGLSLWNTSTLKWFILKSLKFSSPRQDTADYPDTEDSEFTIQTPQKAGEIQSTKESAADTVLIALLTSSLAAPAPESPPGISVDLSMLIPLLRGIHIPALVQAQEAGNEQKQVLNNLEESSEN